MKIDSRKLRKLIASQGYTNKRLAEAAGVSRPALQAILTKDRAEVRGKTLLGLIRALKLPDESALLDDPLTKYKEGVAEDNAQLDFRGLGLPAANPLFLDELFIPVRVRRSPTPLSDSQNCGDQTSPALPDSSRTCLPPEEEGRDLKVAECLCRYHRLLVRGEPGSGKTTTLRHLARSYAESRQQQDGYPEQPLTPLFVRPADYARERERDRELGLVRFAVVRAQPEASAEAAAGLEQLLEGELRQGKSLVLLDGLDEVGHDNALAHVVRDFLVAYPNNYAVLTSRGVGLDPEPWRRLGFATFEIMPWQEKDISQFALRWTISRHGLGSGRRWKECARRAEELTAAVIGHPRVREIATNPLMLTILTALHDANVALPRRRVDLYAKIVAVFLDTWETAKRAARPSDLLHGITLEAREYGWLLGKFALTMQRQDRVLSPRWWVAEFVQSFLRDTLGLEGDDAKDQADRVIRHLCERSGLLVERGTDVFGFWHLTFQEYFAGRGLIEEAGEDSRPDVVRLLRPNLYHPRWSEVVRLVGAQLTPVQAAALLRTILDDPDPTGRFLRRGQLLALRCLVDGTAVTDKRLLGELFSTALLGESKWLGITFRLIQALRDLKGTRFAPEAEALVNNFFASAPLINSHESLRWVPGTVLVNGSLPSGGNTDAQMMAEALADGRVPWSREAVAKAEAVLVNVAEPCLETLHALERLLDAKEVRGGSSLENILSDALAPFAGHVAIAFVFGSIARREQGHDSDIDLLVVGGVRLKELAGALHSAEQALGRIINPALYTTASFREKYEAGDPFLLEIVRNEKVFLKGDNDELRELVAERSPQ